MAHIEWRMRGLSVVIVSYGTARLTLTAAKSGLHAGASEIVVVDNASQDETVRLLRGVGDGRITVVQSSRNDGFGVAANRGARTASEDVVCFLNSDATISADTASCLVEEVLRLGGHGIVGPRLLGPAGQIQASAGLLPGPLDLAVRSLGFAHVVGWLARSPWRCDIGSPVTAGTGVRVGSVRREPGRHDHGLRCLLRNGPRGVP